jgi:hypothetical protein
MIMPLTCDGHVSLLSRSTQEIRVAGEFQFFDREQLDGHCLIRARKKGYIDICIRVCAIWDGWPVIYSRTSVSAKHITNWVPDISQTENVRDSSKNWLPPSSASGLKSVRILPAPGYCELRDCLPGCVKGSARTDAALSLSLARS